MNDGLLLFSVETDKKASEGFARSKRFLSYPQKTTA
jgi:hypothetical protein